jgi:A/G-specific adenine glycosylase
LHRAARETFGDAREAAGLGHRAGRQYAALQRHVAAWFARHARDFPWRRTRDPYRIWVSEVMLQQTQAATVVPYFEHFLAAFPDLRSLAEAPLDDVLRLWEGLGYYRRATQLHRAARQIVSQHGGVFPRDPQAVRNLPGIGRYTAGAILSLAFDARLPILEANTMRLLARWLGVDGDLRTAAAQRTLWAAAEALLPQRQVGRWNQALMELGATVCTPRRPRCDCCPLASHCAARQSGRQEQIPRRTPRVRAQQVHAAALVIGASGGVLLLKRADGGRWGGLWDFPRLELPATETSNPAAQRRWIGRQAAAVWGLPLALGEHFATLHHGVTRFRITLDCYRARLRRAAAARFPHRTAEGDFDRRDLAGLQQLAMTRTARRIAQLLAEEARPPEQHLI